MSIMKHNKNFKGEEKVEEEEDLSKLTLEELKQRAFALSEEVSEFLKDINELAHDLGVDKEGDCCFKRSN